MDKVKRKASNKMRRITNGAVYLTAFAIPVMLTLAVMIRKGITPFGDKSLFIWDAEYQYKDYFGYLWDILHGNASIEFSAGKSLGGKMTGLFGYYLSSPLNILLFFFQKSQIAQFMSFMTVLRIGLCGLTSQFFFRKRFSISVVSSLLLSTAYALMEYNIYYCRNIMWMDGVIMLPLVAYGVYSLVHTGKKNILWISTAVAIIANWYTGYMICFMSGICFIYEYYLWNGNSIFRNIKKGLRTAVRYIAVLLGGVLTSMAVLLPACMALVGGKATNSTSFGISGKVNYDLIHFLSGFDISGYGNEASIPLIFCGSVMVILAVYYLINSEISLRRRLAMGTMLLFLAAAFCLHDLELLWTGFVESYSFFYRFAFVFSFAVIFAAGSALEVIEQKGLKTQCLIKAMAVFLFFGVLLYRSQELISDEKILKIYAIVLIVVMLAAFLLEKFERKKWILWMLSGITVFELTYNAIIAFRDYTNSTEIFSSYVSKFQDVLSEVDQDSDGAFYRFEKAKSYLTNEIPELRVATCESSMYGYNSIEYYSSAYDNPVDLFLMEMGYSDLTARQFRPTETYWNSPMLLTDSLLSIKYAVMGEGGYGYEKMNLSSEQPFNGESVYKNQYALPLGYNVSEDALAKISYGRDPFENQERFLNGLLGETSNIYDRTSLQGAEVNSEGMESYTWKAETSGPVYVYADGADIHNNYGLMNCELYVNDKLVQNVCTRFRINSVYVGDYEAGDILNIRIRRLSETEGSHILYVAQLQEHNFETAMKRLSKGNSSLNVDKNVISGTYATDDDALVMLAIPYEKNWKAYIDGEQASIENVSGIFLGLRVAKGSHEIYMKYENPEVRIGILLSGLGILLLCLWNIVERKKCFANYKR